MDTFGPGIGIRYGSADGRNCRIGRTDRNSGIRSGGPAFLLRRGGNFGMEKNLSEMTDRPNSRIPSRFGNENRKRHGGGIGRPHVACGQYGCALSPKRVGSRTGNPVLRRNGDIRRGLFGIPDERPLAPGGRQLRQYRRSRWHRRDIRQEIGVSTTGIGTALGNLGIRGTRLIGNPGHSGVAHVERGHRTGSRTEGGPGSRTVLNGRVHGARGAFHRKRRLLPFILFRYARNVRVRSESIGKPVFRAEIRKPSRNPCRHRSGDGSDASGIGRDIQKRSDTVHVVQYAGDSRIGVRGDSHARSHPGRILGNADGFYGRLITWLRGARMDERRRARSFEDSLGHGVRHWKNRSGNNRRGMSRGNGRVRFPIAFQNRRRVKKRTTRPLFFRFWISGFRVLSKGMPKAPSPRGRERRRSWF